MKKIVILSAVMLLLSALNASAAAITWNGSGDGISWVDGSNWSSGNYPGVGNSGDQAIIKSDGDHVVVDGSSSTNGYVWVGTASGDTPLRIGPVLELKNGLLDVGRVFVGEGGSAGTIRISGGRMVCDDPVVAVVYFSLAKNAGGHGTLEMSGGELEVEDHLYIGQAGTGTVHMTGGEIILGNTLYVAQGNGATADVVIDGGTIRAKTFTLNMDADVSMEMNGGRLIIEGNEKTKIQGYIDGGFITSAHTLNLVYNGSNTILSAIPKEVTMFAHALFHDHMVLQRDMDVPIWGRATTGAVVTVWLDGSPVGASIADDTGAWMAHIGSYPDDGGQAHTLTISSPDEDDIVITDVVFGDVYLAAGEANMYRPLTQAIGYAEEAASADYPLIRQVAMTLTNSPTTSFEPELRSDWTPCGPATAGAFSGTAYFFAKELHQQTGVPVGLLFSAWGGQKIERFLSAEGLASVPELAGFSAPELSDIHNAMIAPLAPYGLRGAIWYQGEANGDDGDIYQFKMRALMRGWRSVWGQGDFPFYFVQLPNYDTNQNWRELREAQRKALSEPGCGMVVLIDAGDDADPNPSNKQDVGYRLAQWALRTGSAASGPLFQGVETEGARIRVLFDHAENGLMIGAKDGTNAVVEVAGPLRNFEVAGADGVFVAADAVIDADSVLVSAASVPAPTFVRYCYAAAPEGSNKLYNATGLPASPFRTDTAYELAVINGGGDGVFESGVLQAITADPAPEGQEFNCWIGASADLANPYAAGTTVTMPEHALRLTATYRGTNAAVYSLTVSNGWKSGTAAAGSAVKISADAPATGLVFDQWTGDFQGLENPWSASTTLIMPSNAVSVVATYRAEEPLPVDSTTIDLSNGWMSAGINAASGARYRLETTTNLVDGTWDPVLRNIAGTGARIDVPLETGAVSNAFYRVRVTDHETAASSPNHDPVIDQFFETIELQGFEGVEQYVLYCNADDPDGDPLSYGFEILSGDGTLVGENPAKGRVIYEHLTPSNKMMRVTVADGRGGSAAADLEFEIPAPSPSFYLDEEAWTSLVVKQPNKAAYRFVPHNPALPNVLLIGDSISVGYTSRVRTELDGEANVYRIPENGGDSDSVIRKLTGWLAGMNWAVVHCNAGLHDVKYLNEDSEMTNPEDGGTQKNSTTNYASNLEILFSDVENSGLIDQFIWAHTTPVPTGAVGRVVGDADKYNKVAENVLTNHPAMVINDLYSLMIDHPEEQIPADVHFSLPGYKQLGIKVANTIRAQLP